MAESVLRQITKDLEGHLLNRAREKDLAKGFDEPLILVVDNVSTKTFVSDLQWLVVKYSTERSNFEDKFLVKFLVDIEKNHVMKKYGNFLKFCQQVEGTWEGVKALKPLIYGDRYIVFESFNGEPFFSGEILYEQKLDLTGLGLSAFHGANIEPNDPDSEEKKVVKVLGSLPLSFKEKQALKKLFDRVLVDLAESYGGTTSFGNFSAKNIFFDFSLKDRVVTWLVNPEKFDPAIKGCRMEDVASFFKQQALQEFKGGDINLSKTRQAISAFLKGYDKFLDETSETSVKTLYEGHLPIEYHIALLFLRDPENTLPDRMRESLAFVRRLLIEKPLNL